MVPPELLLLALVAPLLVLPELTPDDELLDLPLGESSSTLVAVVSAQA